PDVGRPPALIDTKLRRHQVREVNDHLVRRADRLDVVRVDAVDQFRRHFRRASLDCRCATIPPWASRTHKPPRVRAPRAPDGGATIKDRPTVVKPSTTQLLDTPSGCARTGARSRARLRPVYRRSGRAPRGRIPSGG